MVNLLNHLLLCCHSHINKISSLTKSKGVNRIENLDKIILEEEKIGIFNLILHNYKRLAQKDGFSNPKNVAEVREMIKRESDKLREFVDTCVIPDPNGMIPITIMHEAHEKFASDNNYEVFTKQRLGANLPLYGIHQTSTRIGQNKKTTRVWKARFNGDIEFLKNIVKGLDQYV